MASSGDLAVEEAVSLSVSERMQEKRLEREKKYGSRTLDMTKGEPIVLILQFAIPLFIGTLFQQAYHLADTMIIGRALGGRAVAAAGATSALYSVLIYFANGMNSGYGIMISRMFGSKDYNGLRKAGAAMVILDAAAAVILPVVFLPMLSLLLGWLDTPKDIFAQSYGYIFVILLGMPAAIGYNMGAGFMRAVGNSRTPLYFLIFSSGVNIVLDFLFVVTWKFGVIGAAAATVIAETLSAVLCFLYICRCYREFLPKKEDWKPGKNLTLEMLSTGLSMGLMQSVFSLGTIILQKGINQLGTGIITAHTASQKINEMLMMPLSMLAASDAVFVGQNFGARQYNRIRRGIKQVMFLELCWSIVSALIVWTAGPFLVALLLGTESVRAVGNAVLNLKAATALFFPLGVLLVLRNAVQPMGCKIPPVISSSIELLIKIIFCFTVIPKAGYLGVVVTEPFIWVVCAGFMSFIYRNFSRKYLAG